MALTLVLGPANSAKAGEVLGSFAAAAPRGAILVVPTAADAEHYARELAGGGGLFGAVTTFAGLAREVAARCGYSARVLSGVSRERVLRVAIGAAELRALGASATGRGFVGAVGELVAELGRSMVGPARFGRALEAWAAEDRRRAEYARDVAALYAAYRAELDRRGVVDGELYTWRALDALREAPMRWGATPVFVYGFDELTALERDAVETLARICGAPVTVSLTFEPGRAAFFARAHTVAELRPLAERVVELDPVDDHYAPAARAALHHLERWLFEPGPVRIDPGGAVRVLEAGGSRAEAELIAANVLALLRGGLRPGEIAIVCRAVEAAAPLLERVLSGYGVPVAAPRAVPVAHTGLGRALLALVRCAWEEGASAQEVVTVLRVTAAPEDADELELRARREGLRSAAEAVAALAEPLPLLDLLLEAGADASAGLARAAREFLALWASPGPPGSSAAPVLGAEPERDLRAVSAVLRALGEWRALGENPDRAELIELLEGLVLTERRTGEDAVQIADPLAVRARRFRAVFVCGLNEGGFPAPPSVDPFLGDEARREIARAAGLPLPLEEDGGDGERYLFYAAVSRATECVVLSFASSDEEGNLAQPSPFLADVRELFVEEWWPRRERRLLADVVWPADAAPTERERRRAIAAAASARAGEVPEPDRRLSAATLSGMRHNEVVSAGALELYADCPVRWLIDRELGPESLDPDADALIRGGYIHEVLERVLRRLGGPVSAEALPRALKLLDAVLGELGPPGPAGQSKSMRAAAVASVRADLLRYFEHEAATGVAWPPAAVELRFGFEGDEDSLPALALGEAATPVRLRGAIDRIDVDPAGSGRAIVRDYKSGAVRPQHQSARWGVDRQLQVPLYMLAVQRLLGLDAVAGFYQPLGGADIRPRGAFLRDAPVGGRVVGQDTRDREELQELLLDAERRALELTARLRSGELEPCPQNCSRDGCRYPGICRST